MPRRPKLPKPRPIPAPICLDKQTHTLANYLKDYRRANATDQDIWIYIGMRWPTLPHRHKQQLFKTQRHYPYENPYAPTTRRLDRSIVISRFPGKVVI
jgi:hypothetical protein